MKTDSHHVKMNKRVGKMVQEIKVLKVKPDDCISVSETHMGDREKQDPKLSSDLHMYAEACVSDCIHRNRGSKN